MSPLYQTYLKHRYPEWPVVITALDAIRQIRHQRARAAKLRLLGMPEIDITPGTQDITVLGVTVQVSIEYDDVYPLEQEIRPVRKPSRQPDRNEKSTYLIVQGRDVYEYVSDYSYEERIENYWKQFGTVRADQLARHWLDKEFSRVEDVFFGHIYSLQYTIDHDDELIDCCGGFDSGDEDYLRTEIEDNVLSYVRSMNEEAAA